MRYSITGATVEMVKNAGGNNIKEARSMGIIFATLTPEQADKLRSLGCQVNQVGEVKAATMPPIVSPPIPVAAAPVYSPEQVLEIVGLDDLRSLMTPALYGDGFNLAIIDSGIRETHEKISGRVVYSKNYTSDPMRDGLDHGTGVCSVALVVAPLCNILNLKVLSDKGEGTEEDVVLAIADCIDLHDTEPNIAPSVINLSLGAPDDGNPDNMLRVACQAAIEKGIWVVASAGNSGPGTQTITNPACERYVAAIGSTKYIPDNNSFVISDWSSRGPTMEGFIKPDMVIFGEDIVMASSASDTATIAKSGTSFAAPFISGCGILYQEGWVRAPIQYPYPVWDSYPELIELPAIDTLIDRYFGEVSVKPQGTVSGKDTIYGWGLPLGELVSQAIGVRPASDFSGVMDTIAPLLTIGMVGMMMGAMAKALQ